MDVMKGQRRVLEMAAASSSAGGCMLWLVMGLAVYVWPRGRELNLISALSEDKQAKVSMGWGHIGDMLAGVWSHTV